MLSTVLLRVTALLPALLLLPAGAAEGRPGMAAAPFAPITLTEAPASAASPLPAEAQPAETAPAAPPKPAPSPWAGTLELYGFAPLRATTTITRAATEWERPRLLGQRRGDRLSGLSFPERGEGLRAGLPRPGLPDQIELPGFTATTDVGLGSLLAHLTDMGFLRGSVEHNRIGFQTDLSYVGLGAETAQSFQRSRRVFPDLPVPRRTLKTQVAATQGIYDFALRYRFGERERAIGTPGAVIAIPYAGVRVLDLGLETTSTFEGPLILRSKDKSFGHPIVQPLVGLQGQVFLTPRLRLFARGDLGGFGSNGVVDMSGNAQAGVGYAIGNSTQLDLSWRYLYLARDNGESPNSAYTIDQNGIEVGVKVFF